MMEFTFQGLLRHGFGFYNPNHAAALIAALLPFLWAARRRWSYRRPERWLLEALQLTLLLMLILTYSRTGLAVTLLELAVWTFFDWRRQRRTAVATVLILLGLAAAAGFLPRLTADRAVTNRGLIYGAGIRLYAANPDGVGTGNSGELVSAFLLPPGVNCRTLVSTPLTWLTEQGWAATAPVLALVGYALLNGVRRRAAWTALLGLVVSSCSSTLFDGSLLRDFRSCGGLSRLNWLLSWSLALGFGGLTCYLCRGPFRPRRALLAGVGTAVGLAALAAVPPGRAPHLRHGEIRRGEGAAVLVLRDEETPLREVIAQLPESFRMPLRPWLLASPPPGAARILLFGSMAWWAGRYPGAELILIAPPPELTLPEKTVELRLPRWYDDRALLEQAAARQLPVVRF